MHRLAGGRQADKGEYLRTAEPLPTFPSTRYDDQVLLPESSFATELRETACAKRLKVAMGRLASIASGFLVCGANMKRASGGENRDRTDRGSNKGRFARSMRLRGAGYRGSDVSPGRGGETASRNRTEKRRAGDDLGSPRSGDRRLRKTGHRRPTPASPKPSSAIDEKSVGQRLQKVLAAAGFGSRRQCEELIVTGRVEVDGRPVTQLGTRVDPQRNCITVDGDPLKPARLLYYAVNKPAGVVSTNRDPSGRPRVIDLAPAGENRLFCVGRLDLNSEGLILLTNDGELTQRLTHPRYEVPKTYRVLVAGRPSPEVLARLKRGVHLAEGMARVEQVRVRSHQKESTVLELVLREGKNREVRRVLARVGHKVMRLTRLAVGPIRLGALALGAARPLTRSEVEQLRRAAGLRS